MRTALKQLRKTEVLKSVLGRQIHRKREACIRYIKGKNTSHRKSSRYRISNSLNYYRKKSRDLT